MTEEELKAMPCPQTYRPFTPPSSGSGPTINPVVIGPAIGTEHVAVAQSWYHFGSPAGFQARCIGSECPVFRRSASDTEPVEVWCGLGGKP